MTKPFLCMIGFHKWGKAHFTTSFRSNVKDYSQKCDRCGEVKKWVQAK